MKKAVFILLVITTFLIVKLRSQSADQSADNTFTDVRNGKGYKTVIIGNQTWMAENLNYITGNSWCFDCEEYGRLYDWETAKRVCPTGWHLPSEKEWQILINYLGGEKVAGRKLKSTDKWESPNKGATNSSGFSALPGGTRLNNGEFIAQKKNGSWWTSTESDIDDVYYHYITYTYDSKYSDEGRFTFPKNGGGLSVRCLRDK